LRSKLDADESSFSRAGVDERRFDPIPDEIEAVFVAHSLAVLAYSDQRVLVGNNELGAAVRNGQRPASQGYSVGTFEYPKGLDVWPQFLPGLNKRDFHLKSKCWVDATRERERTKARPVAGVSIGSLISIPDLRETGASLLVAIFH
jgi:hypothetical protein